MCRSVHVIRFWLKRSDTPHGGSRGSSLKAVARQRTTLCMDGSSTKLACSAKQSLGRAQAKLVPRWKEGDNVGVSELAGEGLVYDERGVHAAEKLRARSFL